MREFYGPWFLEAITPRLVSGYVWVVVLPYSDEPLQLEIVIYPTQQDSRPRKVIALWKSKIEEPIFDQRDPKLSIFENISRTKHRLASGTEDNKQQLQSLYNACRGIRQVKPPSVFSPLHTSSLDSSQPTAEASNSATSSLDSSDQPTAEASNAAMSSSASVQSKSIYTDGSGSSGDNDNPTSLGLPDSKPVKKMTENVQSRDNNTHAISAASSGSDSGMSVPSAPPIPDEISSEGPIRYPSIDSSASDVPVPSMVEASETNSSSMSNAARDSSCAICWDAPVEGACIPCGHMAGCMACLNRIKVDKGACPICLTKMDHVVRLHAV